MATWFLEECPKCGGDLYLDPLGEGDIVKCLQCGLEVKLSFLFIKGKLAGLSGTDIKTKKKEAV